MSRKATATIDVEAFRHNYRLAKIMARDSRAMAVVKANGYGHGAAILTDAFLEADAFAVATLEEALELRENGVGQPIVLLEGFFAPSELPTIVENDLELVIHSRQQLHDLLQTDLHDPLNVWLKLDSGMHRLGFLPGQVASVYQELDESNNVADIRLMTHFACADVPDDPLNRQQLRCFRETIKGLHGQTSLANSAALISMPEAHGDWVRPGIMLYGSNPFAAEHDITKQLRPVMTLSSELIAIHHLQSGESVGYGQTWTAKKPSVIGTVALGYADGYPRHAPSGTPVLVNGQRVPLVGRVSMDMLSVDITDVVNVKTGDKVVLWGKAENGELLSVDEIASAAGTISYELFTGINQRVMKKYIGV